MPAADAAAPLLTTLQPHTLFPKTQKRKDAPVRRSMVKLVPPLPTEVTRKSAPLQRSKKTNVDSAHDSRFKCNLIVEAVHNARRVLVMNGSSLQSSYSVFISFCGFKFGANLFLIPNMDSCCVNFRV